MRVAVVLVVVGTSCSPRPDAGNGAPVGRDDSFAVREDRLLETAAPGVLANDRDPDGDDLAAELVTSPAHGLLTLSADGGFTFAPDGDCADEDSFAYRATDGISESDDVLVIIHLERRSCSVAGECVAHGTPDPVAPCGVCDSLASLTAWSPAAEGTRCGLCQTCDAARACAATPADDVDCGAIDCTEFDTECWDAHDVVTGRCASFATCRSSSAATCAAGARAPLGSTCGTGPCMTCDGHGGCAAEPLDDPACPVVECDTFDTSCRDYQDLTSDRCAGFGACKTAVVDQCTAHSDTASGTLCGAERCRACDGAGSCVMTPADDPECGVIDCDGLDAPPCADYHDFDADRCDSLGRCKADNDVWCTDVTLAAVDTTCGVCDVCDSAGACVPQGDGDDLNDECPGVVCTDYLSGWDVTSCRAYASTDAARNGACDGASDCWLVTDICNGTGAQSGTAACAEAECNWRCPTGGLAASYAAVASVCYQSGQRGCAQGWQCGASGACENTCEDPGTCTPTLEFWDYTVCACVPIGGSCPFLYVWDGNAFAFQTDINGPGKLAAKSSQGYFTPNPYDTYVLRGTPVADGGSLQLRLVEERMEVDYIDSIELFAVDVPAGREVVAQKLSFGTPFTSIADTLHTVGAAAQLPASATHVNEGVDVSAELAASEGVMVQLSNDRNLDFEYHTIELDLGDLSSAEQIKLVIDAVTGFPTTPEGVARSRLFGPRTRLEVVDPSGAWVSAGISLPKPPEFRRRFALDITDAFVTNDYRIRLTFLFKTWIDAIAFDTTVDEPVVLGSLAMRGADLRYHGFGERTAGEVYEHRYTPAISMTPPYFPGDYTHYGDVTPLLADNDDRFVIFFGGDEIALSFAPAVEPPAGVERQYVLYSQGYYKDHKVDVPHTVEPLPFAVMSGFPYGADESYPTDAEHEAYRAAWNTRRLPE